MTISTLFILVLLLSVFFGFVFILIGYEISVSSSRLILDHVGYILW